MMDRLLTVPVLGPALALLIIVVILAGFCLLALVELVKRHGLLPGFRWWRRALLVARRA